MKTSKSRAFTAKMRAVLSIILKQASCSRRIQNEGDQPLSASPMASRMMSTTRPGAVTIGA